MYQKGPIAILLLPFYHSETDSFLLRENCAMSTPPVHSLRNPKKAEKPADKRPQPKRPRWAPHPPRGYRLVSGTVTTTHKHPTKRPYGPYGRLQPIDSCFARHLSYAAAAGLWRVGPQDAIARLVQRRGRKRAGDDQQASDGGTITCMPFLARGACPILLASRAPTGTGLRVAIYGCWIE